MKQKHHSKITLKINKAKTNKPALTKNIKIKRNPQRNGMKTFDSPGNRKTNCSIVSFDCPEGERKRTRLAFNKRHPLPWRLPKWDKGVPPPRGHQIWWLWGLWGKVDLCVCIIYILYNICCFLFYLHFNISQMSCFSFWSIHKGDSRITPYNLMIFAI